MRLIDADALEISTEFSDDGEYSWDKVPAFRIQNAPTIDAVPVVRCKDCKHLERYQNANWCEVFDDGYYHPADDDFCSHGERRSDG